MDPFHDFDLLATSDSLEELDDNEPETERIMHITVITDGDNEESEFKDENRNIFNVSDEE